MADFATHGVFVLVSLFLLAGIGRQFTFLGPRGQILDRVGLLPQWKFFALSAFSDGKASFDDHHLLVRQMSKDGSREAWQEIFWNDDRHWVEMFWNPDLRSKGEIQKCLVMLQTERPPHSNSVDPTSLNYLTALRYCLDKLALEPGNAVQFAVVTTRGRQQRSVAIRFVSAWHIP